MQISHTNQIIYITPGCFGNILAAECFIKLKQTLIPYGYELRQTPTADHLKNFAFLIHTETPREKLNYPKEKLILFLMEPPVVIPHNHDVTLHAQFNKIVTWQTDIADNKRYFQYFIPQAGNLRDAQLATLADKQKLCVLINKNKHTKHPDELLSQRAQAVNFFEHNAPDDFDLYGNRWSARLKTYKGTIPAFEKINYLKKYKFCICYENMRSTNGYISEKIFDCLRAGCVPIYLGAANISDYVPTTCFIPREQFESNQELYDYIKNMPDDVYQQYLDTIADYLKNDPRVDLFSIDHFVSVFLRVILNKKSRTDENNQQPSASIWAKNWYVSPVQ